MPKRRLQELNNGGDKRSRLLDKKKKHLYVVLDDCSNGFSMYKIDAADLHGTAGSFPWPAALRLAAPVPGRAMKFAAMGSKIFIATNPRCGRTPALVYDAHTSALALGPPLPAPLVSCFHISIATADNTLYGMSPYHININRQHSFEAMSRTPPSAMEDEDQDQPPWSWSWRSVPSPPPFGTDDTITSYVLHPDGRTVFMSAHSRQCPRLPTGTVSFHTQRHQWKWHGEWVLPFRGQGHYAADLDAWVGLRDDGHVCSCQVVSRTAPATSKPPEWKTVKDKLFFEVPERRIASRPTLTYMGDDATFCLAEFVVRRGVDLKHAFGDADGCVLRMSTFRVRYDHKGELHTTGLRTNSFLVSKHLETFSPLVFWM